MFELAVKIIASLAALVGIWFAFRNQMPRLRIALNDAKGELTRMTDGTEVRYHHIRVYNQWRAFPAKRVRLLLRRIYEKQIKDDEFWDTDFKGDLEMRWRFDAGAEQYPTVGPEVLADLCYLPQSGGKGYVCPRVLPTNFPGVIKPGYMLRLELVAATDYKDSNHLWVDIKWDGRWHADDMIMAQHLVVRLSRAPVGEALRP